MRQAAGDAHHLHHVLDPLAAKAVGVHHLVGQKQLFTDAIKMPDAGVNINRFHRIASGEMDAVEILRQLHQVPETVKIAGNLAGFHVPVIRWRRNIAKQDMLAANRNGPVGVSGRDGEPIRHMRQHFHHEIAPHSDIGIRNGAARRAQNLHRFGIQKLDSDFFQYPHCAIVNRLDPFGGQRFGWPVGIQGNAPRHLFNGAAGVASLVAGPPAASGTSGHRIPLDLPVAVTAFRWYLRPNWPGCSWVKTTSGVGFDVGRVFSVAPGKVEKPVLPVAEKFRQRTDIGQDHVGIGFQFIGFGDAGQNRDGGHARRLA